MFFSTAVDDEIRAANMIFVAVNTPTATEGEGAGYKSDLQYWEGASRRIATVATDDKIVIEKSTLPVRTAENMEEVMAAVIAKRFGVPEGAEGHKGASGSVATPPRFHILSNPEFLAEGTAVKDLEKPDRVLIGGNPTAEGADNAAVQKLASLYANWVDADKILTTNLWSSELSKLVANAVLAQRVSSINSISALCEKTGADVSEVARAIGMDSRIGSKFLQASVGFGGSCFQKDILNLVYICRHYNLGPVADYWEQVVQINNWQKSRFAKAIFDSMHGTIKGKRIALLGFAFKKDTGDTRESPAIDVVRKLLENGAHLAVYDPKVTAQQVSYDLAGYNALPNGARVFASAEEEKAANFKGPRVIVEQSAAAAAKGAHGVAVITEWDEFRFLDHESIYKSMESPAYFFDGRNILGAPPKAPTAAPASAAAAASPAAAAAPAGKTHADLMKIGFKVFAIGKPFNNKKIL